MNKFTFCLLLFLSLSFTGFAQVTLKGKIVDAESLGVPGVNIVEAGTTNGTVTDIDGNFSFTTKSSSGSVVISYIGFASQTVAFTESTTDLGTITMSEADNLLEEIVVFGVTDIATDRRTPVAVSTIKAKEIEAKMGNQEFPEVLKNTPSIYVAGQASGFGDSRIVVRGFDQTNTAFLLNGQPINGMEDGRMYWSNWSGMTDIANAIQIQRGLGSSKLAISSVGGTVNIVTKATEKKAGGFIRGVVGNDAFYKGVIGYNTGLMSNGLGVSFMATHWQGDGYNYGTQGQGQNYFLSIGYQAGAKHNFNFMVFGAPQWHNQKYSQSISTLQKYGRGFNNNNGTLNGEFLSEVGNYYHKPVANLNWDWLVNDRTTLSTVLYASWGRGGSIGNVGSRIRTSNLDPTDPQYDERGYVAFDAIVEANKTAAAAGNGSTYALRSSVNDHNWVGVVSKLETELGDNITFNVGADVRTYKGLHYRRLVDLLGANYFQDNRHIRFPNGNQIKEVYEGRPWPATFFNTPESDRYAWDYDERITYGGLFTQLEYASGGLSAFVQGSASVQSHVRWDRYQYTEENEKSETVTNPGFNIKGGFNYNLNDNHGVFFNTGFYSRQPYHDNIYLGFGNTVNPFTVNEKVFGLELGYKLRTDKLDVNVNLYRTSWKDRVETDIVEADGNITYFINRGVHQVHMGGELDVFYRASDKLRFTGFLSVGNWEYVGSIDVEERNEDRELIETSSNDVDGGKVGDAAQTSAGIGARYQFNKAFSIDADWRFYDNLYSNRVLKDNIKAPNYDLADIGVSYNLPLGDKNSLTLRANVNNVFGEIYISDLQSANVLEEGDESYKGLNVSNRVYFGNGRTWNFTATFRF